MILACRSAAAGANAADRIRSIHRGSTVSVEVLDLASFSSIFAFAARLTTGRIDVLVLNAGITTTKFMVTAEEFEVTVGVCHIGHALLTRLLMGRLLASPSPRVVVVSSDSHLFAGRPDFAKLPTSPATFDAALLGQSSYCRAKLFNVLFAMSLHRYYGARLCACSLHPGSLIQTNIDRGSSVIAAVFRLARPFTKSVQQGAATSCVGALHEPAAEVSGKYLRGCAPARASSLAYDAGLADALWAQTDAWIAEGMARAGLSPEALPAWPTRDSRGHD